MTAPDSTRAGEVGAVVLTHGTTTVYELIVDDLIAQGLRPEDLVVVHNPVGTGEGAPAVPDGASVIQMQANRGYTGGMNAGLKHHLARGVAEVLVVTHEVRLRPGALQRMIAAARAHPDFGALGPTLVHPGIDVVFSRGGSSGAAGGTRHEGYGTPLADGQWQPSEEVADCDWLDGAAIMFRAAALAAAGVYDERLFIYGEDAEICLRLRRSGWRVGAVRDAIAEQASGIEVRSGAHAFLVTRNGLHYRRLVAGRRGVLLGIWHCFRDTLAAVKEVAVRSPDAARRRFLWARTVSSWAGVAAFALGRWGRPPGWLPGLGDMKAKRS